MSMEFIVHILCIVVIIDLSNSGALEEILSQLLKIKEYQFFIGFHQ
jgi:hypothetical protein